eukprot:CAMPEP_0114560436 /NCGR_PEP_ID=MMETSP0114-20121206/11460_1 /TAXON_ID=31324 /ORGANISM="Goniomonas sp, Strain m" /LENGTH=104 /DNA_ID=CAMNT_0001745985 /DNA_START=364 /DNA_END=678 /DNA_ORIENTATION=-
MYKKSLEASFAFHGQLLVSRGMAHMFKEARLESLHELVPHTPSKHFSDTAVKTSHSVLWAVRAAQLSAGVGLGAESLLVLLVHRGLPEVLKQFLVLVQKKIPKA